MTNERPRGQLQKIFLLRLSLIIAKPELDTREDEVKISSIEKASHGIGQEIPIGTQEFWTERGDCIQNSLSVTLLGDKSQQQVKIIK